jgi:hypothetical protein
MKVQAREPVDGGSPDDELLLGASSWNDDDASLKYGWLDRNGKRTRGGELPLWAAPQAVVFAVREGYLDRQQVAGLTKALIDILCDSPMATNDGANHG